MIHSFLLIGQSNMAGRGFLKDVEPIREQSIKMLRNGRWQVMNEPINYDRPFSGIGLSASFAYAWHKDHPEEEIGLIPCADGGSALDEWMPGEVLFDHAVAQAKLAQRSSVIAGILWHQGETDCPLERIACYEEKLEVMLQELRKQLDLPSVPFIMGGLGDFLPEYEMDENLKNVEKMNETLQRYAEQHENCYFVTARGLTSNPDHLHFNAVSQRIFGLRYYEVYKTKENLLQPLINEEELAKSIRQYAELSIEEKSAYLKQQMEAGKMTKQQYEFEVAALIREM